MLGTKYSFDDIKRGIRNPSLIKKELLLWLIFIYNIPQKLLVKYIDGRFLTNKPHIAGPKSRIKIGSSSLPNVVNTRGGEVIIGDNVMFGHLTVLVTGHHDYRKKGYERVDATVWNGGRDIIVRDGVWIGANCTIIGPCEIGENAVIAAGSTVVKDCDSGAIYAGNPAEKISTIDFK